MKHHFSDYKHLKRTKFDSQSLTKNCGRFTKMLSKNFAYFLTKLYKLHQALLW